MNPTRRTLLAAATAGVVGAAGCLDFAAGDGPQGPEGQPATLACETESFTRLDQPFPEEAVEQRSTSTDDGRSVELSPEGTAETYGQDFRVALRNRGDEPLETLGEHAYSLQRETDEGWLDVRGHHGDDDPLPTGERTVDSGSGYNWSLRLREDSIAEAVPDADLSVCPALGPGRHRFVYWGVPEFPPLSVEFDLIG